MLKIRLITLTIISALAAAGLLLAAQPAQAERAWQQPQTQNTTMSRGQARLIRQIRNELVTLPYYDVFDWLEGEVREDGTVILRGQVVRPTTKSGAEARIKDIEGIERVVNEIEVLPVSQNDDRIRLAVYRALFDGNSQLFRYALRSVPPIHIIVRNGRVTLKGVVATKQESNLANIKARSVPGVFEVTNELRVESDERR